MRTPGVTIFVTPYLRTSPTFGGTNYLKFVGDHAAVNWYQVTFRSNTPMNTCMPSISSEVGEIYSKYCSMSYVLLLYA